MCVYIHTHTLYIYIYIYIYIIYIYIYIYVCTCKYPHVYPCIYIYYVYMYICIYATLGLFTGSDFSETWAKVAAAGAGTEPCDLKFGGCYMGSFLK